MGTGGANLVLNMLPARDLAEYRAFPPEDIASLNDMVLAAFVNSVEHWIPTTVYLNTVGFAAAFAAGKKH